MRKSNYMAAAGGLILLLPAQEMAAKKKKREGSDRPRTLGGGVMSNGCSGTEQYE